MTTNDLAAIRGRANDAVEMMDWSLVWEENDIPALCDEVEALRGELAAAQEENERLRQSLMNIYTAEPCNWCTAHVIAEAALAYGILATLHRATENAGDGAGDA